jgi:hypothetical protein
MKETELDKLFDDGEVDVLQQFDLSKAEHPNLKIRRVNVDFPAWMVDLLDRESARIGVTRQSLIKSWLADKLDTLGKGKNNLSVAA